MGATHSSFNVEGGDYYKRVRAEAKAEKEKNNNTRDSNNNKDNNNNNKERDNNKRLGYPEEEAAAVEEERGWDQWTLGGSLNFFEEKGWDPVPEYKYHQYLRSRTYQ